ncbi:hypothetical protein U8233_002931 [Providencia rettgeri]|nr:hypothetical protein [Providencia rettgeri]
MQIKSPPSYLLQVNKGKRKAATARAAFSDSVRLGDDVIYAAKLRKPKPYTTQDMAVAKKLYLSGIFSLGMYDTYCKKPSNKKQRGRWHRIRMAMEKLLKEKVRSK